MEADCSGEWMLKNEMGKRRYFLSYDRTVACHYKTRTAIFIQNDEYKLSSISETYGGWEIPLQNSSKELSAHQLRLQRKRSPGQAYWIRGRLQGACNVSSQGRRTTPRKMIIMVENIVKGRPLGGWDVPRWFWLFFPPHPQSILNSITAR